MKQIFVSSVWILRVLKDLARSRLKSSQGVVDVVQLVVWVGVSLFESLKC